MNRISLITLAIVLSGCATDQLDGEYNDFEGRWNWFQTEVRAQPVESEDDLYIITREETGYSAQIELTSEGRILFYRDGFVISDNRFKLLKKSDGTRITIEVKGETTGDIDLPADQLGLSLFGDTLVTFDYPFQAIDNAMDYVEEDAASFGPNYFFRE